MQPVYVLLPAACLWRLVPAVEFGAEAALPALPPPAQKIIVQTPRSCAWLLLTDEDKVNEDEAVS